MCVAPQGALTGKILAYVHPGSELPGRAEPGVSAPESRAVESELTSSSSQHSVLFTPPTYVLTYQAKQFLY